MKATKFADSPIRAAEAIVRVLEGAGINQVFTLPGGKTIRILDALLDHSETIRTVSVRDEEIATIMAEVSARFTGTPAVAMGQACFMLSKAGIGMLEAHLGSTPMVILTDLSDGYPVSHHAPYQDGTGGYGNWDAVAAFRSYTKYVAVARYPEDVVQLTQLAIKHAISGEPGPVVVLYHSSIFDHEAISDGFPKLYDTSLYLKPARTRLTSEEKNVARIAKEISIAERPVIIAGGGVRLAGAFRELEDFALAIDAPVVTTATAKGVLAENHDLAGGVMGTYAQPTANELLGEADLIVAIGTKLGPNDTMNNAPELIDPVRQSLIHIDVEPLNISWTIPADDFLVADLAWAMEALSSHKAISKEHRSSAVNRVALARKKFGYFDVAESDDAILAPEAVVTAIRNGAPDDAIITCDAGENRLFMMHYFQTRSAGTYIQPGAGGGMGFALPAALAARLNRPDTPVIAVCGDGGFGMSIPALLTAQEENLPIIVVVMNNSSLGWVKNIQGDRAIATDYETFDFAAMSKMLGCQTRHVSTAQELSDAIREASATLKTWVIEVEVSLKTTHRDITSPWSKNVLRSR